MSNPETFEKEVYKDLALGYKRDYDQVVDEIKTFEGIFKDKKWKLETRSEAKRVLVSLYEERDEYATKAEHYRTLYLTPSGCKGRITWGKI